ncbi:MAG: HAD family hydrolase [Candidatus Poribacteria bacterium]
MERSKSRKAVFLDLQGTLGGEGFGDILDFAFFPFTISAIKLLNETDFLSIIVTNQSHIAKGHFTINDFDKFIDKLKQELADHGAKIDGVYCCPHGNNDDCSCRKPSPGLIFKAQEDFNLDLSKCYVIGDAGYSDMLLAKNVGCPAILVLTGLGKGSLGEYRYLWADFDPDFVADDVFEAVMWIRHYWK